jgi:hypothetical protein
MTTIAFDGKTLAADTASFLGNDMRIGYSPKKLIKSHDKVFAFAGNYVLSGPWMKWFLDGRDPEKKPGGVRESDDDLDMWVWADGKLHQYTSTMPYPWQVPAPFAMGSGGDFAMGAFRFGELSGTPVSAEQAVLTAIACDPFSGGPVQIIDLESLKAEAA